MKWISKYSKFWQRMERKRREDTVVRHDLVGHTIPSVMNSKLGDAVAVFAISLSVKSKAHPPELKQGGRNARVINPRNTIVGDIKAASSGAST